jgi:hypothetical protein
VGVSLVRGHAPLLQHYTSIGGRPGLVDSRLVRILDELPQR